MSKLNLKGNSIRLLKVKEEDYVSLNDIAAAAKYEDTGERIKAWIRAISTVKFLAEWEKLYNPNFNSGRYARVKQEVFDNPPLFDYEQRKRFFSFPNKLLETARTLRTLNSQIGFLLLCGYFKATKRFFLPQDFHQWDINAIAKILNLHPENFSSACYVDYAVPATIYLALKYEKTPEQAMIANTMCGGDNVGRGAVLGALLGAVHGMKGWPAKWVGGLLQPPPDIEQI